MALEQGGQGGQRNPHRFCPGGRTCFCPPPCSSATGIIIALHFLSCTTNIRTNQPTRISNKWINRKAIRHLKANKSMQPSWTSPMPSVKCRTPNYLVRRLSETRCTCGRGSRHSHHNVRKQWSSKTKNVPTRYQSPLESHGAQYLAPYYL